MFVAAKSTKAAKSKDEQMQEKKRDLEKRLQDVSGQLGGSTTSTTTTTHGPAASVGSKKGTASNAKKGKGERCER